VAKAIDAGMALADPTLFGNDDDSPQLAAFVVPAGGKVEVRDIEDALAKYRATPSRKTGCFHVHDADSFISYVRKHGLDGATEVWSDAQGQRITGVINGHSDGSDAGWGDHSVVYQVALTDAWKAWMRLNGNLVDQVTFANHVEDRMVDIIEPDAATLLEIAQSFEATTRVAFESANVLSSGERQFVYREETDARAGQSGTLSIPKEFVISVQPFEGAEMFELTARLRYRLREGQLTIGYQLVRPEDILRAAFVSVSDHVAAGVDAPVFLGTTA
jgi:uncharacterized protein YfdQ (DUF2303 family)